MFETVTEQRVLLVLYQTKEMSEASLLRILPRTRLGLEFVIKHFTSANVVEVTGEEGQRVLRITEKGRKIYELREQLDKLLYSSV